jgi:hypothetical protein
VPLSVLLLLSAAACSSSSPPGAEGTGTSGPSMPTRTYVVTLSGTVSGHAFSREAELRVEPTIDLAAATNGVNPYEVCLRSGFPGASPEVGAIWFGTNTGCFDAPNRVDMVESEVSGSTYVARPDDSLSQLGVNGWTAAGGAVACIYAPIEGSATYEFTGDTVTGRLDLVGFAGGCSALGNRSTYTATLTGAAA